MKPSEVAIVVGVVLVLGYFWYRNHATNAAPPVPPQSGIVRFVNAVTPPCGVGINPTNAQTPIYGPTLAQAGRTCCGAEVL